MCIYRPRPDSTIQAFTLIELSIVLVIIGLIVGGILTGQDLIHAAEQRATLAQIEKYNTATNTFRNKFGGIPGDLAVASASAFGLTAITGTTAQCWNTGSAGCGDGNGLIDGAGTLGSLAQDGEPLFFWVQLSGSGLVDGNWGQCDNGTPVPGTILTGPACGTPTGQPSTIGAGSAASAAGLFPQAKLGRANFITVAELSGTNYFAISGMSLSTYSLANTGLITNGSNNLTPLESYNMDRKVDDGLPESGSVQVIDATAGANGITTGTGAGLAPAAIANCDSTTAYLFTSNTMACSLRLHFN